MLFVVAGPSGSGKSTFIKLVLEFIDNAKVIDVDVCTPLLRIYEKSLGRILIDIESFNQKFRNSEYSIVNNYDDNNYGYKFPLDCNKIKSVYLLDYPGEYPECPDLINYNWKGILILPPNEDTLIERLKKCNRENRICSAINEYNECINDIITQKLDKDKWFIVYNNSREDLINGLKEIFKTNVDL